MRKMHRLPKHILCIMSALLLVLFAGKATPVLAGTYELDNDNGCQALIVDNAGYFTDDEAFDLLDDMEPVTEYYDVAIYTTTSHNYSSTASLAEGVGCNLFGYDDDFIIFVIDRDLNQIYLYSNNDAYSDISSSKADNIVDQTYIYATSSYDYDYYTCCEKTMALIATTLEGGHVAQPMKIICNLLLAFAISLIVVYFIAMGMSRSKKASTQEVLGGTFTKVFINNPRVVHTGQTKKYSPQSSGGGGGHGGGGGGGGHSGGGGGHGI